MKRELLFIFCLILPAGWLGTPLFAADIRLAVVQESRRYLGDNYCRGGTQPPCFDCSGFVRYILSPHVEGLPRVSRDMARFGTGVSREDLSPGDLVFFATTSARGIVSHVAIYIGQDSIIHAISDGPDRGVNITSLNARYWRTHFHSAVRVLPSPPPAASAQAEESPVEKPVEINFAKGTYTGELKAGEPHGNGFMSLANGDTYRGEFQEGVFHGSGTYTWKNGDIYQGSFREGRFHGGGVFTSAAGVRTDSSEAPETFMEVEDSPWESWDGYITGDYYAWRQKEQESFEQWKQENRPKN